MSDQPQLPLEEQKRQITDQEARTLARIASTIHLHDALLDIQCHLKVAKRKRTKDVAFASRTAEEILAAAKPFLLKHRCIVTVDDELVLIGDRFMNRTTATISNGIEQKSAHFDCNAPLKSQYMSEQQTSGSTGSYGKKYALQDLFALDDETLDPDLTPKQEEPASPEILSWLANALDKMDDIQLKDGSTLTPFEYFCKKYKVKKLQDLTQTQAEAAQDTIKNRQKGKLNDAK